MRFLFAVGAEELYVELLLVFLKLVPLSLSLDHEGLLEANQVSLFDLLCTDPGPVSVTPH